MKVSSKVSFGVSAVAAALVVSGCAATSTENASEEAPIAEMDGVDEQDEGASYNGWSHSPSGTYDQFGFFYTYGNFTKSSGTDATRGGGVCLVYRRSSSSCSSDSTCLADAQSQFGASAYGYCYGGGCYTRPGSQAAYCGVNSSRSPGAFEGPTGVVGSYANHSSTPSALGCMTKTAGPNTACGGTDTSLYMRRIQALNYVPQ
jgi:hypothetical protein